MNQSQSHRFRNQLNQFVLQAMELQTCDLAQPAAALRQLELLESLSVKLNQFEEDVRQSIDPEFLEAVTRILVVEDDAEQRLSLATALRANGFFVATANGGADAIAYLHQAIMPDVILMDISMPDCDGNETSRVIHHVPFGRGVKMIAVTALARSAVDLQHFDGYIQKPFAFSDLIECVRAATLQPSAT